MALAAHSVTLQERIAAGRCHLEIPRGSLRTAALLSLAALGPITSLRGQAGSAHPASAASVGVPVRNDALLKAVDDHYNHLATLRTRYTEVYSGMGLHRSEAGTLTLKKPGRMHWTYDTPAGKVFLLDSKYAWFYTPGDAQAQRLPAKQMDDLRTPLRFLLGHTQLKKELDGISVTPDATGFRIAGVPRGMQQRVKELSLHVTATGQITAMKVEEVDGATTEFSFTGIKENIALPDGEFTFTPPAGVAVVNALPPI